MLLVAQCRLVCRPVCRPKVARLCPCKRRKGLAQAYIDLGFPKKAVEQAEKAFNADTADAMARYVFGKALVKNKQYQKGYDILVGIPAEKRESEGLKDKVDALLDEIRTMQGEKKSP